MKLGQYFLDLCKKLSYFILLGEDEPILTNIFQMGWFNHQLVYFWLRSYTYTCWWFHVFLKCHPYLGNDSQFLIFFKKWVGSSHPTQYMFFPSFLVEFLLVVPFIKFTSRFRSQPGWGQAVGIDVLPMQDGFDKGKDAKETPHGSGCCPWRIHGTSLVYLPTWMVDF